MSIASNLAVMRNAFSTASATAKIPDGSVSHSLTERLANAGAIASPQGRITILIGPQLNVMFQYADTTQVTALQTVFNRHSRDRDNIIGNVGNIDQWRLVSTGLRLGCINGSETLNGWFEAVRMTSPDYGSGANFETGELPADVEGNILNETNWANHPSYVTGRLRDLSKHTFYLQPVKDTFDFVAGGLIDDRSWDFIAIRIHSIPSGDDTLQTSIHYHVVKNFELCYDANSALARFQTTCPVYKKGVESVRRGLIRDPKATMIRQASAYAYK